MNQPNNNDNRNGGSNGSNRGSGPNRNRQTTAIIIIAALLSMILVNLFSSLFSGKNAKEIKYNEFLNMLAQDKVESVELQDDQIMITQKPEKDDGYNDLYSILIPFNIGGSSSDKQQYYTGMIESDTKLVERLEAAGVEFSSKIPDTFSQMILNVLFTIILPFGLLWLLFGVVMKKMGGAGGGIMGMGKSNAKMYMEKETGVTFADVAGQDEAKESLQEVVDFLHNPEKYTGIGAKLPKGVLLVGPPGTGKTLLAKAVAGEAHVPFFSLSGSSFEEVYVGVGASRVRDLFKQAEEKAPCIIFIDEIDAIGKSRDAGIQSGSGAYEQTLNQLLSEMDGFDASKGILILAATNRPEVLDKALLRPGRFDRRVVVEKPDLKGRVETLKVHAKNVRMDETVDFDEVALATSGAVGSDLANMINEAAILAVKRGRKLVSQKDLLDSVEVVLVGQEKKDRIMSLEERKIVSYHEVGHALIAALQNDSEPVQKITIIPRTMGALGFVMQTPEEEKFLNTKNELKAMLVGFLAGRAAEEIVFNTVTTGAANDIERATQIARAMVTQYGMSEKFGLIGLESVQSRYLDGRPVSQCGDATEAEIDEEVIKLLKNAYEEAKSLLRAHRMTLDKIAAFLIKKETITGKEFMDIFKECEGLTDEDLARQKKQNARIVQFDEAGNAVIDKETDDTEIAGTADNSLSVSQTVEENSSFDNPVEDKKADTAQSENNDAQ